MTVRYRLCTALVASMLLHGVRHTSTMHICLHNYSLLVANSETFAACSDTLYFGIYSLLVSFMGMLPHKFLHGMQAVRPTLAVFP